MICMIPHMVYNFNNKIWNQWFLSGLSEWVKQIHIYTATIEILNLEEKSGSVILMVVLLHNGHGIVFTTVGFLWPEALHVYDSNQKYWTDLISTDTYLLHLIDLHFTADLLHSKFFHKRKDSCIERQHFRDAGRVVLGIWCLCWGCFHNSSTFWWFNVP